jgi:hypothetical protein
VEHGVQYNSADAVDAAVRKQQLAVAQCSAHPPSTSVGRAAGLRARAL